MEMFARQGKLNFTAMREKIQADFVAKSVDESETAETIREFYQTNDYILDPHTAVGIKGARSLRTGVDNVPVVCLATAHPAKFGQAVASAIGHPPVLPPALAGLQDRKTRCEVMEAQVEKVRDFIAQNAL